MGGKGWPSLALLVFLAEGQQAERVVMLLGWRGAQAGGVGCEALTWHGCCLRRDLDHCWCGSRTWKEISQVVPVPLHLQALGFGAPWSGSQGQEKCGKSPQQEEL